LARQFSTDRVADATAPQTPAGQGFDGSSSRQGADGQADVPLLEPELKDA